MLLPGHRQDQPVRHLPSGHTLLQKDTLCIGSGDILFKTYVRSAHPYDGVRVDCPVHLREPALQEETQQHRRNHHLTLHCPPLPRVRHHQLQQQRPQHFPQHHYGLPLHWPLYPHPPPRGLRGLLPVSLQTRVIRVAKKEVDEPEPRGRGGAEEKGS